MSGSENLENSRKIIEGTIYSFFPVKTGKEDDSFESCDTWHWKVFGWWFEMYTFIRATIANLMGVEVPFEIKVKKTKYEKHSI